MAALKACASLGSVLITAVKNAEIIIELQDLMSVQQHNQTVTQGHKNEEENKNTRKPEFEAALEPVHRVAARARRRENHVGVGPAHTMHNQNERLRINAKSKFQTHALDFVVRNRRGR